MKAMTTFINEEILTRALDQWAHERLMWIIACALCGGVGLAIGRFY